MKPVLLLLILSVFSAIIFLTGCEKNGQPEDQYLEGPDCEEAFTPKASDYQVVGFYPSWKQGVMPVRSIPWEKLTRIIFAFAIPNADGTLNTSALSNIKTLRDSAHNYGVEIYFSVGGGDGSANFPVLASRDDTRTRFVKEVRQFIFENCLDGVDIDWEYWSGYATNSVVASESQSLVILLKELRQELDTYDLGISIDLGASDWGGKHFFDDVSVYADHLQVMAYDFSGPWSAPGPHSAYEDAIGSGSSAGSTGLAYWVNYRGWPEAKVLLGVPFYGRDFDNQGGAGISYFTILQEFPDAYLFNQVENIYYDGIQTIADKTHYVIQHGFSGIMIWEITQDTPVDSTGLLHSIHQVLHP
jgi:GH18 family chitinase